MSRRLNLQHQTFGRLFVVCEAYNNERRGMWECLCDCGITCFKTTSQLTSVPTPSCGCYVTELLIVANTTHGMSGTPEYRSWGAMKDRCYNHRNADYDSYGGRGIKVCEQWLDSFEAFFADVGYKPTSEHTIDRYDVDGDYEPDNCRWATPIEQANNKRQYYNSRETRAEWLSRKGKL